MSVSLHSFLTKSKGVRLFEVGRSLRDVGKTTGFVVAFSDSLVLIHALETGTFKLNGYTVLRIEDITRYRVLKNPADWLARAARHFQLKPICPAGISVASLPELVKSVAERYPLITFHPEKKVPDVCYTGPLLSMTQQTFTIEDLSSEAKWSGPRRMKFNDVTRVDFGGGYEAALAVAAPKRPKAR